MDGISMWSRLGENRETRKMKWVFSDDSDLLFFIFYLWLIICNFNMLLSLFTPINHHCDEGLWIYRNHYHTVLQPNQGPNPLPLAIEWNEYFTAFGFSIRRIPAFFTSIWPREKGPITIYNFRKERRNLFTSKNSHRLFVRDFDIFIFPFPR